jgi:hypothetical protein
MINEICNNTKNMISFSYCLRELEHRDNLLLKVSLHKDPSMNEHSGHIVHLWGLYSTGSSCLKELF